jgi:hypothetical protein
LYADLRKKKMRLCERLAEIEQKYGLGVALTRDAHQRLFASLEYLNEAHRAIFAGAYCTDFAPNGAVADVCERFFAYLVFRHASSAECEAEFAVAVSMAHLLTRVFYALISANDLPPVACARILSEELEYSEENTAAIRAVLGNEKKEA